MTDHRALNRLLTVCVMTREVRAKCSARSLTSARLDYTEFSHDFYFRNLSHILLECISGVSEILREMCLEV